LTRPTDWSTARHSGESRFVFISSKITRDHDAFGPDPELEELDDFEAAGLGDKSLSERPNRLRCGERSFTVRVALASIDCSVAAIRSNVVAAND
jgi:hypothetical protein